MENPDNSDHDEHTLLSRRHNHVHSRRHQKRQRLTARTERAKLGSDFEYKPLDRSKGAIRLIRICPPVDGKPIECQIIRAHISTTEYVAVSYVWGTEVSSRIVSINGESFHVRPNLYEFLHHASTTRMESLFWVDAICINQSDLEEKNSHVRHMGTIFANATKVISWLGYQSHSPSTTIHRDAPLEWLCCDRTEHTRPGAEHQKYCDWKVPAAWSWELVRHEYWSRLWIVQELGLAKRVDILWKGRFYDWSRMKNHLNFHMHRRAMSKGQTDAHSRKFSRNLSYIAKLPIARYLRFIGSGPLGNLVPQFADHGCQIGHDHVFGLLSLARDGSNFEPDYRESNVSLLFRLMNFCYDNPVAAFTKKIGTALDLDPHHSGISVTVIGRPQPNVTSDPIQHIQYHFTDTIDTEIREEDIVVRLADTYLNILFRPSNPTDVAPCLFTPFARVSLTSTLVENAARRFGPSRSNAQWKRDQNVVLEQAVKQIHRATLKIDPESREPRLFCDWQTILAIFEASETDAAQGRLESRIRRWIAKPPDLIDRPKTFTVR